jgi:hypothetical protein
MAVQQPETLSRERATELVRAWAGGRPGPLGSVLGRLTAVDQVGVEQRVDSLKRRSIKRESKLWALDLAIRMIDLTTLEGRDTYEALGPRWMTPDRFRFGASTLLNDVLMQIQRERTGRYQDPDDFTID